MCWKEKLINDIKKNKINSVKNFIKHDDCNIYINFLTIETLIKIAIEYKNLEIKLFLEKIYNKKNELINAIKNNNLELVNSLFVEHRKELDLSTVYDAIETASEYGNLEVVKLYYENHNFPYESNSRIKNALDNAFKNNHLNIITYIIDKLPEFIDEFIYKLANLYNNFEFINILSNLGVNIYSNNNIIRLKSIYKDIVNIKFLIKNNVNIHINNEEILRFASLCGNLKIVKYLVENGANINANDDEALRNTFYNESKIMMLERCVNICFNNNYDDSNYYYDYNNDNKYTHFKNELFLNKLGRSKIKIRKYLIENGANINANNGEILIRSINNSHFIKYLIKKNVNIHANNDEAIRYVSRCNNYNCLKIIKLLLKNGANINANNDEVIMNLFNSYNSIKLKEINFLVKNGANINVNNDIIIRYASKHSDLKTIKCLIKNGANIHANNDEAFKIAVKNNNLNVVQYLIKNGVNINSLDNIEPEYIDNIKFDLINIASQNGYLNIIKYFDEQNKEIKYKYIEILQNASENGHLEIIKYLKNKGVNIHYKNDYIFIKAIENNQLEVVKYLVENGVNINNNVYGEEPLITAIENGHLKIVKYLVENGANINNIYVEEHLITATENGHLKIVKYLVENGADINANNNEVLKIAVDNNHLEIIKYFIKNCTNIHANDEEILRKASKIGHFDIVKILIENGANIHANNNESLKNSIKYKHNKIKNLLIDNYKFPKKPIDIVIRENIDDFCSICYSELKENDIKIICSKCNHIFKKESILEWLYSKDIIYKKKCPFGCDSDFYEL